MVFLHFKMYNTHKGIGGENLKQQSATHHTKYQPLQHFIWLPLSFLMLLLTIGYIVFTIVKGSITFETLLLFGIVILSIIPGILARKYALTLQDRLIRTEEQLRYFMLSNKRISPKITLQQLIALRFASDEEYLELVEKTLSENLSPASIKQLITNWRADNNRV